MTASNAPWREIRRNALRAAAVKPGDPRFGLRVDLWRALGRITPLPFDIDFRAGGNSRDFALAGGWANPEPHGCWTAGPIAQVAVVLEAPLDVAAVIEIELASIFLAPQRPSQRIAIDVNGLGFAPWLFDDGTPREMRRVLHVPADAVGRVGAVLLTLDFASSEAPYLVGAGDDTRDLGVAVRRMGIRRSADGARPDESRPAE